MTDRPHIRPDGGRKVNSDTCWNPQQRLQREAQATIRNVADVWSDHHIVRLRRRKGLSCPYTLSPVDSSSYPLPINPEEGGAITAAWPLLRQTGEICRVKSIPRIILSDGSCFVAIRFSLDARKSAAIASRSRRLLSLPHGSISSALHANQPTDLHRAARLTLGRSIGPFTHVPVYPGRKVSCLHLSAAGSTMRAVCFCWHCSLRPWRCSCGSSPLQRSNRPLWGMVRFGVWSLNSNPC